MSVHLRVLIIEDSELDSDLIISHLEKASYRVEYARIDTADEMKTALETREWDLVISDFNLPSFDALSALALLQGSGHDIPFIVVSGTIGEETAVGLMKAGAHDYLMKDRLARLVPAIKRELVEAQVRREHRQAQEALQESQTRYRLLFDQSPFGVLLLDPDSTCPIDFNNCAHTQLGYSSDEFARLPLSAYEIEESRTNQIQKGGEMDGGWNEFSTIHRTKSGELRSIEVTIRKMMLGGAQVLHCVHNDVTERKQIEASFHQSEQQFQTLTHLLPVGVYRTDAQGRCQYANRKWLEMAGMTIEQARGDGWILAIHPDDKDMVMKNWGRLVESKGTWGFEYRFRTFEGKITWIHGLASELFDEDGQRLGFIGANIDITERKQAEEALRESEEKFRRVFDNSVLAISLADLNGRFTSCNPAVTRILGYSPEEYAGLTIEAISHPDDAGRNIELYQELLAGKRESYTMEKRNRHKDGHHVWGQLTSSIVRDANQKPLFTIGMFEDITERKAVVEALQESEEKFRRVFNNSGVAISLVDLDGHFFNCNPAVTRILGYTPEEYSKLTILSISHPDDSPYNEVMLKEMVAGKRDSFNMEKRNRHKDGHYVWGQLTSSIVRDASNKPLFVIGMFEDITERKAAVEALRESKEHYQSLFENMMNGFAFCQMCYENDQPVDFIYQEVNDAFINLTGYKHVTGKKVSEVIPGFAEKDLELLEMYSRVALSGKPETFEYFVNSLNDWYSISVYSPKREYFVAIFDVITARKLAEESLREFARELEEAYDATLQGWSAALEMRERETAGHSHRVVSMTLELARAAGINGDQMTHIERGALLHDIGKMGIPDSILLKPGPLTDDEWVVMRQHPVYAYRLLSHIPYLRPALEIPYYHHERWDGSGYPQGLAGEAIPMPARLFAIIDVWDALSSNRPYRPAWTPDAVRTYVENQAGKQFDPKVVELFLKLLQKPELSQ
ncbi:MAG: PAS domain S-box protein [Anaerolineaceae bacterium]